MLIGINKLLRTTGVADIDTRQILQIGFLKNLEPYPTSQIPTVAILHHSDVGRGGLVLGNTTARLKAYCGDSVSFVKTIVYSSDTKLDMMFQTGPTVVEYLSIVLPNGDHQIYKCRRRSNVGVNSLVFPEQIDRFANVDMAQSWFQTPILAFLSGQAGSDYLDPSGENRSYGELTDQLLESVGHEPGVCNSVTPDVYTAESIIHQMDQILSDFKRIIHEPNDTVPNDVITYWAKHITPEIPYWDMFFRMVVTGTPVHHTHLLSQMGHTPCDLSQPPALVSKSCWRVYPIPFTYLDIAEMLEKIPTTDFAASVQCGSFKIGPVVVEYEIDRFAALWSHYRSHASLFLEVFTTIYDRYKLLAPNVSQTLIELRIEKTFGEEAIIEFLHHDDMHDHAMHVDFALLSYCSVGVGRYFDTQASLPT